MNPSRLFQLRKSLALQTPCGLIQTEMCTKCNVTYPAEFMLIPSAKSWLKMKCNHMFCLWCSHDFHGLSYFACEEAICDKCNNNISKWADSFNERVYWNFIKNGVPAPEEIPALLRQWRETDCEY